jgi:hypothetical protein
MPLLHPGLQLLLNGLRGVAIARQLLYKFQEPPEFL